MITTKSKKLLILILLFNAAIVFNGKGQVKEITDSIEAINGKNYYLVLSAGLKNSIFRDFATSPLFYNGYGLDLRTEWLKRSEQRERALELGLSICNMTADVPKSNYIQPKTNSSFVQLNIRYNRLVKLKAISNSRVNYKLGGTFQTAQNVRLNSYLDNNAVGLENITNLMFSAQMTKDVSRNQERNIYLWHFKIKLRPVKRDLRFQLNYGIANFNYRPGYTYSNVPEINGAETSTLNYLLSSYSWTYFDGQRCNTDLEYIKYMPNGNARSLSYVWDIAYAPGKHEAFQMASHQIRYRLYFNNKKR